MTSRIEWVAVIGIDTMGRIACSAGVWLLGPSVLKETRHNKKTALCSKDKLADRVCLSRYLIIG